jgi:hypothetical protein
VYLIGIVGTLSSCEDVLDKKPLDLRTENDVWADVKLAQAYMNRIWYATNRTDFNYESWFGFYAGPLTPGSEVTSDNYYSRWNRGAPTVKSESGIVDVNANFGVFDNFGDLRNINIAIDHLTDPETRMRFGENIADDMLGQAYFAKGLIYSVRAKVFGGYPIIEKTLTAEDDLMLKRASLKETYDYAINLLELAIPLLNATTPAGRPNKGAALALLSETCINSAAYIKYEMLNGGNAVDVTLYYNKAIKAVEDLDALGLYSLEPQNSFAGMFSDYAYAASSASGEIILAQFTPPSIYRLSNDKQVELNCYLPTYYDDLLRDDIREKYNNKPYNGFILNGGWQSIAPNPKTIDESFYIIDIDGKARRWQDSQLFSRYIVINDGTYGLNEQAALDGIEDISQLMYGNRDKRFYATIAYDGCTYFNNRFDTRIDGNMHPKSFKTLSNAQGCLTGYLFKKCVPETQAWTTADYSGFHKICLRLSRAYLNVAEAYLMLNNEAKAKEFINKTRMEHGGLPVLTDETGDTLWKIYIDERNAELIMENDRYYTLMRYGIKNGAEGIDELNFGPMKQLEISADGKSYKYVDLLFESANNTFKFSRHRYLFPVPKAVTDRNPNYLPNNPRY